MIIYRIIALIMSVIKSIAKEFYVSKLEVERFGRLCKDKTLALSERHIFEKEFKKAILTMEKMKAMLEARKEEPKYKKPV